MKPSEGPTRPGAPASHAGEAGFEPGAVLAMLDGAAGQELAPEAASAWDAAWIACLTNSPRWAETARREFARFAAAEG